MAPGATAPCDLVAAGRAVKEATVFVAAAVLVQEVPHLGLKEGHVHINGHHLWETGRTSERRLHGLLVSVDGLRWFLTVRSFLMAKFSGLMSHRWSLWVKSFSKCDTMSRKLNAMRCTISLEVLLPRGLGLSGPETATSSSEKMFWSQVCPADRYSTA